MMRDYKELVERLHKRIAVTYAGSPCQEDLLEAADAIEAMCEMVATANCELANVIQCYEESKPCWIPVKIPETPTYTTTTLVDISTESINKIAEAVVEKLRNCGAKMESEEE